MKAAVIYLLIFFTLAANSAQPAKVIELWPKDVPGEKGGLPEERDMSKAGEGLVAGKPIIRLGNVSKPTISIFSPAPEKDTGAAVLVFPGGGYSILALDLEGSEACEWLNSIGVTAVLLKYRVPKRQIIGAKIKRSRKWSRTRSDADSSNRRSHDRRSAILFGARMVFTDFVVKLGFADRKSV